MFDWLERLRKAVDQEGACVLVTVAEVLGSAPREPGARLIVERERVLGSIGGGALEHSAIAQARELLSDSRRPKYALNRVSLGPQLGQCCGGAVRLAYERIDKTDRPWLERAAVLLAKGDDVTLVAGFFPDGTGARRVLAQMQGDGEEHEGVSARLHDAVVRAKLPTSYVEGPEGEAWLIERLTEERPAVWLFGAGHIGREIATLLGGLPFRVVWLDSRAEQFPEPGAENVTIRFSADPAQEAALAPPATLFLVMTHSHQLDEAICEAVLQRDDFAFLGLIGSASKRARFEKRWRARGIAYGTLSRLTCPIGVPGITGKAPKVIAIAAVAQILREIEQPSGEAGI